MKLCEDEQNTSTKKGTEPTGEIVNSNPRRSYAINVLKCVSVYQWGETGSKFHSAMNFSWRL